MNLVPPGVFLFLKKKRTDWCDLIGHPDAAGSMGHKEEQSVGATSPSVHDRLSMLKEDAHLMEAATDFVNRLLRLAQDEARQHDLADKVVAARAPHSICPSKWMANNELDRSSIRYWLVTVLGPIDHI